MQKLEYKKSEFTRETGLFHILVILFICLIYILLFVNILHISTNLFRLVIVAEFPGISFTIVNCSCWGIPQRNQLEFHHDTTKQVHLSAAEQDSSRWEDTTTSHWSSQINTQHKPTQKQHITFSTMQNTQQANKIQYITSHHHKKQYTKLTNPNKTKIQLKPKTSQHIPIQNPTQANKIQYITTHHNIKHNTKLTDHNKKYNINQHQADHNTKHNLNREPNPTQDNKIQYITI